MIEDAAMAIRPLTLDDLPAALTIQEQAYPPFLLEYEAAFASRIETTASYCLGAVRDGQLVGYLLAHGWASEAPPPVGTIIPRDTVSEALFIHDLAASSAVRGFGVGQALVSRAFNLAARDGLRRAELIAVQGAARYWRRLGFVEADTSAALAVKVAGYGANARWMVREIGPFDR